MDIRYTNTLQLDYDCNYLDPEKSIQVLIFKKRILLKDFQMTIRQRDQGFHTHRKIHVMMGIQRIKTDNVIFKYFVGE